MAYNNMLPMRITLRREFGEPIWNDQDAWSACWSAILSERDIEVQRRRKEKGEFKKKREEKKEKKGRRK